VDLDTSFGRWIRTRRRALDLTQDDLAWQVGCSVETIRKIEADERRPSRQIAERLANCLKIPAEERAAMITLARGERYLDPTPVEVPQRPLHAPPRPPTNLPAPLSRLIGRKQDSAAVCNALLRGETRLLTLVGPPGIGKTHLSIAVARDIQDVFADGAYFVALASISDAALVLATIAPIVGVREIAGQSLLGQLKVALQAKRVLLVLDNFEHVLNAAPLVAELLEGCPGLKALVTSRAALHVRGERLYALPPLLLPDLTYLPTTVALARTPAVALFVERAQALLPHFRLTEQNAAVVAETCVRLDGLPLAIELAATRIKLLSPEALLARLEQRLALLTDGARDLPPRHRTLRAAIAWSYDLLDAGEQKLFRRLGVFVGGCTLEAAEAVCDVRGDLRLDVLDGLATLVDTSVLRREKGGDGEPRFTMLETIREYALEQLEASGEAEALRGQHTEYYLALAETAERELHRAEQLLWLQRLDQELDNLRAALAWSQTSAAGVETGLRLAGVLGRFWQMRGHQSEGRAWLLSILAHPIAKPTAARAKALNWAGFLVDSKSQQKALFEESLAIGRPLGDPTSVADALRGLGNITEAAPERTRALLEESLALCQGLGDTWRSAMALYELGRLALQGDFGRAIARFEESLALSRQLGDRWGSVHTTYRLLVARMYSTQSELTPHLTEVLAQWRHLGDKGACAEVLNALGESTRSQREYGRAAIYYAESLALWQELGDRSWIGLVRQNQGYLAHNQGDEDLAAALLAESLVLVRETGQQDVIAWCLAGLGMVAMAQGRAERAARLLGAAKAPFDATGSYLLPPDRAEFDRNAAAANAQLGEEAFAAAWEAGQALTLDQAIAYALGEDA
jgi:predicted ATPase/transcriptional regulator with XRE-family HTH domain